ncbi:MAG: hypothetical protein NVSMB18_01560 [Acetobacteraceae bacterium]
MVDSVRFRSSRSLVPIIFAVAFTVALAIGVPAHRVRAQAPPVPPGVEDSRPLSPAQIALFETAHLGNVTHPTTLRYTYRRVGPAGFTDTIAVHVQTVGPDGMKDVVLDYLTGPRHVGFPPLDHFRGNPLLMVVLDRDVAAMNSAIGVSTSWFRNRVRESFVEAASVGEATAQLDGAPVPARAITVQPFRNEARLARIASLQAKRYTFVLADAVPGMIAEIRIDTPADEALHAPAMSEQVVFQGVDP